MPGRSILPALIAATLLSGSARAEQTRAEGVAMDGLQAVITIAAETAQGQPIPVTLELCNVSEQDVSVDPWIGNWFVDVKDSTGRTMPHRRCMDCLRPMPPLKVIAPKECWKTELETLRIVGALPGSTPTWDYTPLPSGEYHLRAEFVAYPIRGGLGWKGKAVSGTAQIRVR